MKWMLLLLVFAVAGCNNCKTMPGLSGNLGDAVERLNTTTETIDTANQVARTQAEAIIDTIGLLQSTEQDRPTIDRINASANTIIGETIRIEEAISSIRQTEKDIDSTVSEVASLEQEVKKLRQAEEDGRSDSLREIRKYITLFFVAGFAMLAGGVFVTFWVNRRMGIAIAGVGILTLGLAAASQYYLEIIAQIGLWVLAGGAIVLIVLWVSELHSSETNKSAIKEIVELIEAMKKMLTEEERKTIFGKDGIASKMTSPMTKHIVSKIRIDNGFKKIVQISPEQTTDS